VDIRRIAIPCAFAVAALLPGIAQAQLYPNYTDLGSSSYYYSGAAYTQDRSARTGALGGGHVIGLIPDGLTDLYRNCAFAAADTGASVRLARRRTPVQLLPFGLISASFEMSNNYIESFDINEAGTAFPLGKGWSCALTAQWTALHVSDPRNDIWENYYRWGEVARSVQYECLIDDRQYFRLDLALARDTGDLRAGLRAGGSNAYYTDQFQGKRIRSEYIFDTELEEQVRTYENRSADLDRRIRRSAIRYVELGILGERSDLALRGSWESDFGEHTSRSSGSIEDSRSSGYLLTRYDFQSTTWSHRGEGDIYRLSLAGRHAFGSGVVVYAGGAVETGEYDSDWSSVRDEYHWNSGVESMLLARGYDGAGDFGRIGGFLRAGRSFEPHEKLEVFVSGSADLWRLTFEELGPTSRLLRTVENGTVTESGGPGIMEIDREALISSLALPVSAEIEPAPFMRLYFGLIAGIRWSVIELDAALPDPAVYEAEDYEGLRSGMRREDLEEIFEIELGFSFDFRERLFLDFNTAGDLTPDQLDYYTLDLRYVF